MLCKRIKNQPENYKRKDISFKAKTRDAVLGSNFLYKKKHIGSPISIDESELFLLESS